MNFSRFDIKINLISSFTKDISSGSAKNQKRVRIGQLNFIIWYFISIEINYQIIERNYKNEEGNIFNNCFFLNYAKYKRWDKSCGDRGQSGRRKTFYKKLWYYRPRTLRLILLVHLAFIHDIISLVFRILGVSRFCVMFYNMWFSITYTPNDWENYNARDYSAITRVIFSGQRVTLCEREKPRRFSLSFGSKTRPGLCTLDFIRSASW